jgi:phospholipase C
MTLASTMLTSITLLLLLLTACLSQINTPAIAIVTTTATTTTTTTTPIKHLIVIFQENVSFDHYFATYPIAANNSGSGDPLFLPKQDTPSVNGLSTEFLIHNSNLVNPFMISRSNALTCDNDHSYTRLQEAYNGGLMDKFVQTNLVSKNCNPSITMGYLMATL